MRVFNICSQLQSTSTELWFLPILTLDTEQKGLQSIFLTTKNIKLYHNSKSSGEISYPCGCRSLIVSPSVSHLLPQDDISDVSAGKVYVGPCAAPFPSFRLQTSSCSSGKLQHRCCCGAGTAPTFEPPSAPTQRNIMITKRQQLTAGQMLSECPMFPQRYDSGAVRFHTTSHHAYQGMSCLHAPWISYWTCCDWHGQVKCLRRSGQGKHSGEETCSASNSQKMFYLFVEAVRTLQLLSSSSILPHVLMADQARLAVIVL